MKLAIAIILEAVVAKVLMGPTCPEEEPDTKLPCVVQSLVCQYGEVTCCEGDHPSPEVSYTCRAGNWEVTWLDTKCGDCKKVVRRMEQEQSVSVPTPVEAKCPDEEPETKTPCDGHGQTCSYGEWMCCGESHPEVQYKCSSDGLWESENLDLYCPHTCHSDNTTPVSNPTVEATCPEEEPEVEGACAAGHGLTCGYGQMTCCGETHPEVEFTCADNGQWTSSDFECPKTCETVKATCPEEEPEMGASCGVQRLTCGYGEVECCGKSHAEVQYVCSKSGLWTSSDFRCPKTCRTVSSNKSKSSNKSILERLKQLLVDRVHEA